MLPRSTPHPFAVLLAIAAVLAPVFAAAEEAQPLRVLVAASLTEVVEALATGFAGARVETAFGASSELARQIRDGAPADVFVSASPDWIDSLREAGAIAGEPIVIARNRLVCIASKESELSVWAARDPRALLAQFAPDDRIAIANPGVPAGEYARSALRSLGLEDASGRGSSARRTCARCCTPSSRASCRRASSLLPTRRPRT